MTPFTAEEFSQNQHHITSPKKLVGESNSFILNFNGKEKYKNDKLPEGPKSPQKPKRPLGPQLQIHLTRSEKHKGILKYMKKRSSEDIKPNGSKTTLEPRWPCINNPLEKFRFKRLIKLKP
ncbi:hypothetical protein AVEN_18835-1 [Araneus ventricosus]|uniref:Uncharacterized protein n=1 Tax=Araneus ventricosus TaxID=182803 RepID=A0A4Y2JGQ8_ARAVE|nr:hypothetical protein AVEN_18835-1 [Araneus ventricosus]